MSRKLLSCSLYIIPCILIFTLIMSTLGATIAEAWSDDPTQNTPICTASGFQERPAMVSDGSGGAIITWVDGRGSSHDIYAQRIDSTGTTQWATNGVAICTAPGTQTLPAIVEDGAGGAIITWQDQRTGSDDIYAQRVDSTGTIQWTANGTSICTEASAQQNPVIASDDSGGAIIAWRDYRSGWYDIYTQRVNSVGTTQWATNGVAICTAIYDQEDPAIISDTSGGAIITWEDARSGWTDIYVQRVDSTGIPQWTANGSAVCSAINNQVDPAIVSAGSGASIIMWQDYRSGTQWDIYARRVNASGSLVWTVDGDRMCLDQNSQQHAVIASDGWGGYVMAWQDYRTYGSTWEDIYAQQIPGMATLRWGQNGTAVCNDPEGQDYPTIVGDGSGGAIIAWQDYRSDSTHDIYAQRIANSGTAQWTANGTAISIAADNQQFPIIVSDNLGGAIIAWEDSRNGNDSDIYAQRIRADGLLPPSPPPLPIMGSWGYRSPTIDGIFSHAEWTNPQLLIEDPIPTNVYFSNDDAFLYVCVDAADEAGGDFTQNGSDHCLLVFDTDHDEYTSKGRENMFKLYGNGNTEHRVVYEDGSYYWVGDPDCDFDACPAFPGLEGEAGFGTSPNSPLNHRIYEFQIPLSLLGASPGDTIGFASPIDPESIPYDGDTYRHNIWPSDATSTDLATWGDLVIASTPSPSAVPTLSQWGMIGMGVLLGIALIWSLRRRWVTSTGRTEIE